MSFFDRQPPLFDAKKRLGTNSNGTSTPGISNVFGSQLQNQGSNDDTESQTGKYCSIICCLDCILFSMIIL